MTTAPLRYLATLVWLLLLLRRAFAAGPGGCVGTIAGVPLHDVTMGAFARGGAFSLSHAAVVDQSSPQSVVIPVSSAVLRVGYANTVTALAGNGTISGSPSVQATKAVLTGQTSVAVGRRGLVIADAISIWRLDNAGTLTLLAGNLSVGNDLSRDGAAALGSPIGQPVCLYVDLTTDDIYYCEEHHVVRVIRAAGPTAGLLSTVAGNGSVSVPTDGALATATGFSDIRDVYVATNGDLLVADNDRYWYPRIVRISSASGRVQTIIGSTNVSVSFGSSINNDVGAYFVTGASATSPLTGATSVYAHPSGVIYFCDNTRIGSLYNGILTVVAGVLPSQSAAVIDGGLMSQATFYLLTGLRQGRNSDEIIAVDIAAEVVYRINLVNQRCVVVAGAFQLEPLTPELTRGGKQLLATGIPLPGPYDIAVDASSGYIYSSLPTGDVVVRVAPDGTMAVIAGTGIPGCTRDNMTDATMAQLSNPTSLSLDGQGGLILADRRCCLIRRLDLKSGFLNIIAGSYGTLCSDPYITSPNVAPGVLQVPTTKIHESYYLIYDQRTGDIFWTEDLSRRVLVRRRNGSIMRIAGNGQAGVDAGGVVAPGSVALNTALAVPSSITLDPWGSVVFLDGYSPGRILRLEPNGTLHVLAAISLSPSVSAPRIDGPLELATAYSLSGLAFVDDGNAIFVADTARVSIVRRIDMLTGNVSTVLGASTGNPGDGSPLLKSTFAYITAVTTGPGGSILVADGGLNTLRVGINENQRLSLCPAGYQCPCGTPIACTKPAQFCPVDVVEPINVSIGYYAVSNGSSISSTNPLPLMVTQAACRAGFYCVNGAAIACPSGTYGVDELQSSPADCITCPAGTFNPSAGATSPASCLPCSLGTYSESTGSAKCKLCPPATFNAAFGANSSAFCIPCPPSKASLPGSSQCAAISGATASASGDVIVIRYVVPPNDQSVDTLPLLLYICVPILFISLLPLVILAAIGVRSTFFKRGEGMLRGGGYLRACLMNLDFYSLLHGIRDGEHPVKLRTSLGGATTLLALGALVCLCIVLGVDYRFNNVLTSTSLLPAELPTLVKFSGIAPNSANIPDLGTPSIPVGITQGIQIRISSQGSLCGAPTTAQQALLAGNFSYSSVLVDNRSASFLHSFSCSNCAFGPLSSLFITFPLSCQQFHATATFIGATGSVSIASVLIGADAALSGAVVSFQPLLEIVNDTTRAPFVETSGYILGGTSVTTVFDAKSDSTVLHIMMPISSSYTQIKSVPIRTLIQLLSSLIGLTGVIGGFGMAFVMLESLCFDVSHVMQEAYRYRKSWMPSVSKKLAGRAGMSAPKAVGPASAPNDASSSDKSEMLDEPPSIGKSPPSALTKRIARAAQQDADMLPPFAFDPVITAAPRRPVGTSAKKERVGLDSPTSSASTAALSSQSRLPLILASKGLERRTGLSSHNPVRSTTRDPHPSSSNSAMSSTFDANPTLLLDEPPFAPSESLPSRSDRLRRQFPLVSLPDAPQSSEPASHRRPLGELGTPTDRARTRPDYTTPSNPVLATSDFKRPSNFSSIRPVPEHPDETGSKPPSMRAWTSPSTLSAPVPEAGHESPAHTIAESRPAMDRHPRRVPRQESGPHAALDSILSSAPRQPGSLASPKVSSLGPSSPARALGPVYDRAHPPSSLQSSRHPSHQPRDVKSTDSQWAEVSSSGGGFVAELDPFMMGPH